ncbi:uncharacterized protein [Rutidosis leptorrhynchoides]|uniref:uncharacterized protein n=1 Tax=Rutidosis leptorrhynchoides TaxID=125765 RepID=UPI003A9A57AF
MCAIGTRIILGWDPSVAQLMVVTATDQVVHCLLSVHCGKKFYVSFVYAANYYIQRRQLWKDLCVHKQFVGDHPWTIMGDFNASLSLEESTASSSNVTIAMREFQECVDAIHMADVNYSGLHYTWNQRPNLETGILKKIDRVMANDMFIGDFPDAYVIFQPYRISDHSPMVLKLPDFSGSKQKPFKFGNIVVHNEAFQKGVKDGWCVEVHGHLMFRVVKRLRLMKKAFRKLMWSKGNIHDRVTKLRAELDSTQVLLDVNPDSVPLRLAEKNKLQEFNEALIEEERFLKQKAKVEWL